jgi:4-aminobutyrate aminotransferase/(S)-3-amino-2-methylpropionate transaminase
LTKRTRLTGTALPELVTDTPGPRSRALAARLAAVESRNITCLDPPPIFWTEARGANVRDVDGNIYVDLTSGFGVATAGHANPSVAAAIARQADLLPHALGDVYPADVKLLLLERLERIMPGELSVSILACSGAEAVEAALKSAALRTGKSGILAFRGAYHGLTYGALATTHRSHFRAPFEEQLFGGVRFAAFPKAEMELASALQEIDELLAAAATSDTPIGAIIVEPIQGRGGIVVPPAGFLAELRRRCDGESRVLIFDEVYTGCGRTGRWLACEHEQVLPDIAVIGKGLSGALPIAACIGTVAVMSGWPVSVGEAIHTSTFLGNPLACAAALAQLDEIEHGGLLRRAGMLGRMIEEWAQSQGVACRGRGLIQGVLPGDPTQTLKVCSECLKSGVLVLAEGPDLAVLAITPPATITEEQLSFALGRISAILSAVSP